MSNTAAVRYLALATLLAVLAIGASAGHAQQAPEQPLEGTAINADMVLSDSIRERVEWLAFQEENATGLPLLSASLLAELYAHVDYAPLWQSREMVEALWELADVAYQEGLTPSDYPLDLLRSILPDSGLPADPEARTRVDLLATEIFLRIGYQLRFGKVDPASYFAEWNFDKPLLEGEERAEFIVEILRSDSVADALELITERGMLFDDLVALLAELRRIEAAGGWGTVTTGATLRPGTSDTRVPELRRRLNVAPYEDAEFDTTLEAAVVDFQRRHGLDADGIVGPATYRALNVPVGQRILQVRASLERARWVLEDYRSLDGPLVLVNIASAEAQLLDGEEVLWFARAQVGRPYRQTPVFRGDMTYLEFNPTWTVPPTILRKDVLPRLRQDGVAYLEEKNMDLLDLDGVPVDLATIEWETLGRSGFPYILRQRPGPWNALGRVKFMFPNSHFIFLHDTPSKALFERSGRAFSSGCIRVEQPFDLAELLLEDPDRWDEDSITTVLEGGERTIARLPAAVPVYLLYWTAVVGTDGAPYFYEDIYGRDEVIFAAMDAEPELDLGGTGD